MFRRRPIYASGGVSSADDIADQLRQLGAGKMKPAIPPRPEVCATANGIERILEEQKSFLRRQVTMRGLVIRPPSLAKMENEMRNLLLEMILTRASNFKSQHDEVSGDE